MPTVLIIAGINGSPEFLCSEAGRLFPGVQPVVFDHHMDRAEDGVPGLAERAWQQVAHLPADEPLYVAGESFGGPIALELARAHVERVAGLILISTFARFPTREIWPRQAGLYLWQILGDPLVEELLFRVRWLEWPFVLGPRPPLRTLRGFLTQPRGHAPAYRQKGHLALRYNAEPWLAELHVPALVLVPRWDLAVPPAAGLVLAATLPRATLVRLPGGHLSHLVHPDLVGRSVLEWRTNSAPGLVAASLSHAHTQRLRRSGVRSFRP